MKKYTFRNYVAYIQDNPEGYWFKRKLYGLGWTPATREGWTVTLVFLIFVLGVAGRAALLDIPEEAVLKQVIAPVFLGVFIFLVICFKTGQSLKWQWGEE